MGTRSITHFKEDGEDLVRIYRQFDGYPTGMGRDLKEAIGDPAIRNGFGARDGIPQQFNGMGCLAAWVIGKLKGDEIGSVYVTRRDADKEVADPEDWTDIEYVYEVYAKTCPEQQRPRVFLKIHRPGEDACAYDGPIANLNPDSIEEDMSGE